MVKKKDLVIVALATFCLTATLFMIISTRSQTENRYNPWMDLDDNGQINILDAIDLANVYDTSGDPAKNVTVTSKTVYLLENLPLTWNVTDYPQYEPQWITVGDFSTEGYSRLRFSAKLTNCTNLGYGTQNSVAIDIWVNSTFGYGSSLECREGQLIGWRENLINGETFYPGLFPPQTVNPQTSDPMLEVAAPYYTVTLDFQIGINRTLPFPPMISCNLSLCVYLRNE